MTDDDLPEPDRRDGVPHPRDTPRLFGQDAGQATFLTAFASGRLHSGWLIAGPHGVGKATFAYRIAAFLLSGPSADGLFGAPQTLDLPADHADLRLIRAGAHPRLFVLRRTINPDARPPRLRQQIVVDDARALRRFFGLSAADGGRRVVIVDAADELNIPAANAILKLLEEPPALATLLLVTHQPSRLLPTIRSRCRSLLLQPLGAADMALALAGAGVVADAPDRVTALAGGSVGAAVRLIGGGGLAVYAQLVALLAGLPRINRADAIRLAESAAGRDGDTRFALLADLIGLFLMRAAHAGLSGPPQVQAAPGETALLARLSPHDAAARNWAALEQRLGARVRAGRAVNLDPAALILDMLLGIEQTAKSVAAA